MTDKQAKPLKPVRKKIKRFRRKITYSKPFIQLLAFLGYCFIKLYTGTLRIENVWHPDSKILEKSKLLYGFWHGRQFLLVSAFQHQNVAIMSDVSWAGEIQTHLLERFGYLMIRGSSKRKGVRALLEMKRVIEHGYTPAFALDGPRGPIYKAKPGIVFLAKKMKAPILPVSTTARRYWTIQSTWCHYLVPKPFSRCLVHVGKPIWCHEMEDDEALDHVTQIFVREMQETDATIKCSVIN